MRRVFFVLGLVACAGPQSSTETPSGGADWREMRIAWDFGPCPNDGRSCHQVLTVHSDGGFIASETPSAPDAGTDATRRFSSLEKQEILEMNRIVTRDFLSKLGSFPCAAESDATVRIEIDGHAQEVGGCVHASSASAPRDLVQLLERHRFVTHDTPPAHPVVPSGKGDPCNIDVGCAKGLQCVVSPCVVAPCTSGSCQ